MDLFKPGMLGILSNLVRICSLHVCAKFSAENGQVEPCFENPGKGRKYYGNPNELAIKLLGTNKVKPSHTQGVTSATFPQGVHGPVLHL